MSILSSVHLGNSFASGRISYGQASTYRPCPTYYVTVLVCVCPYICTTLAITIGWPPDYQFKEIASGNKLINCPTIVDNIMRAHVVYGPTIPTVLAKKEPKRPQHTQNNNRVPIPEPILEHHRQIDIKINYLFINGRPYFHTISDNINSRTTKTCKSRDKEDIFSNIRKAEQNYDIWSLQVTNYHGNKESSKLQDNILTATMNI